MRTKRQKVTDRIWTARRMAGLLAVILLIFLAAGCRTVESGTDFQEQTSTPPSQVTLPPPLDLRPEGTIRVAVRIEKDLNPLHPKHYATASLLRLAYQPLFDFTDEGRLAPVLVDSFRWSGDWLEWTFSLKEGVRFHDGSELDARDALASLLQYLNLTGELTDDEAFGLSASEDYSPDRFSGVEAGRRRSLRNIEQATVNEEGELVIGLREPDPLLPRLLLFPVVPEAQAGRSTGQPVTGTGDWEVATATDRGFTMVRRSPGGNIRQIEALAYPSVARATRDFELGAVDLVLMDATETSLFADRSRIRKQRFDDGGFISLYFGSHPSSLDKRDALLFALHTDPGMATIAAPHRQAAYPVFRGDFRTRGIELAGLPFKPLPDSFGPGDESPDPDQAGRPATPDRPSFVLLAPRGFQPSRLIDRLATALLQINRQLRVVESGPEGWPAALQAGQYDAALLVDTARAFQDPVDYLEGLESMGLVNLIGPAGKEELATLAEGRLVSLGAVGGAEATFSSAFYVGALVDLFEDLPLVGLGATGTMIWYSREVEGTLSGNWRDPYRGLEDLLVWRR